MKFDILLVPFHRLGENPSLPMARDMFHDENRSRTVGAQDIDPGPAS